MILLIAGLIIRLTGKSKTAPAAVDAITTEQPAVTPTPQDRAAIDSLTALEPLKITSRLRDLGKEFNDSNANHLVYAAGLGIKPIVETRDIMSQTRPIVELKSNDNFVIDDLTHSYPFLVPESARLLNDIGEEFNRRLAEQNAGKYRIIVTSLLRTAESVRRLKRGNSNSTENSAHLYGTTFDISYVRFEEDHFNTRKQSDAELKLVLAAVLKDLRDRGRCLVKFERKQSCFHITATGR